MSKAACVYAVQFGIENLGYKITNCSILQKIMKKSVFLLSLLLLLFGVYSLSFAEQKLLAIPVTVPPLIDGLTNDPAWKNAPVITTLDKANALPINIMAVYTNTEIFFQVSFPDPDESRTHKSWAWDNGREMYTVGNDREDIFVFKWNMESKPVDLSINSADVYQADIWYWKACRTDGVGFADDKSHIYSPEEDRNATKIVSRAGKIMYLLRASDEGESAYNIDLISEYQGDILPRYTIKQPTGSRSDVLAKGVWHDKRWTIEFGRKLVTGNQDDIQFTTDKKYVFGVSRYEIAGRESNAKLSDPLYGTGDVNETLWLEFIQ